MFCNQGREVGRCNFTMLNSRRPRILAIGASYLCEEQAAIWAKKHEKAWTKSKKKKKQLNDIW